MSGTWTIKFALSPRVKLHANEVDAGFSVGHLRLEGVGGLVAADRAAAREGCCECPS